MAFTPLNLLVGTLVILVVGLIVYAIIYTRKQKNK